MSYSIHNFKTGTTLYAKDLNEMENQISLNDSNITRVSNDLSTNYFTKNETSSAIQQSTVSKLLTIPADAWQKEYDESHIGYYHRPDKAKRLRLYSDYPGDGVDYKQIDLIQSGFEPDPNGVGNDGDGLISGALLSSAWRTITLPVTLPSKFNQLCFKFYGGVGGIHPYDIADVQFINSEGVNLLSDNIAELNWWMPNTKTYPEDKFAVAYEDNLKYIHVYKQTDATNSGVWTHAFNAIDQSAGFKAGKYTFSCRMRETSDSLFYLLPLEGIRAESSTIVTPVDSSVNLFNTHLVRCFAQKSGELSFRIASMPQEDITLSIHSTTGKGGSISNVVTGSGDRFVKVRATEKINAGDTVYVYPVDQTTNSFSTDLDSYDTAYTHIPAWGYTVNGGSAAYMSVAIAGENDELCTIYANVKKRGASSFTSFPIYPILNDSSATGDRTSLVSEDYDWNHIEISPMGNYLVSYRFVAEENVASVRMYKVGDNDEPTTLVLNDFKCYHLHNVKFSLDEKYLIIQQSDSDDLMTGSTFVVINIPMLEAGLTTTYFDYASVVSILSNSGYNLTSARSIKYANNLGVGISNIDIINDALYFRYDNTLFCIDMPSATLLKTYENVWSNDSNYTTWYSSTPDICVIGGKYYVNGDVLATNLATSNSDMSRDGKTLYCYNQTTHKHHIYKLIDGKLKHIPNEIGIHGSKHKLNNNGTMLCIYDSGTLYRYDIREDCVKFISHYTLSKSYETCTIDHNMYFTAWSYETKFDFYVDSVLLQLSSGKISYTSASTSTLVAKKTISPTLKEDGEVAIAAESIASGNTGRVLLLLERPTDNRIEAIAKSTMLSSPISACGYYTGTGTCGINHPQELVFNFIPKFVLIYNSNEFGFISANNDQGVRFTNTGSSSAGITFKSSGKGISWYSSSAAEQFNSQEVVYNYIAIG